MRYTLLYLGLKIIIVTFTHSDSAQKLPKMRKNYVLHFLLWKLFKGWFLQSQAAPKESFLRKQLVNFKSNWSQNWKVSDTIFLKNSLSLFVFTDRLGKKRLIHKLRPQKFRPISFLSISTIIWLWLLCRPGLAKFWTKSFWYLEKHLRQLGYKNNYESTWKSLPFQESGIFFSRLN